MALWQTVDRPGYFGRHREAKYREYDVRYGTGQWRLGWQIGDRVGEFEEATMVYEDAYTEWLKKQPGILELLIQEACEVFDDAPSNVRSGLNYACQETKRTHLQDIAIRRSLVRVGRAFQGTRLIQIRDSAAAPPVHRLSLLLSPGRVPFHRPDWIVEPRLEGWWQPGSVEDFYQSNKLLQVRG